MKIPMSWWLLAALVASPASAMDSPAALLPQGVYADNDNAAAYLAPPPGMRSQFRNAINATLRKNPKNAAALVHRAYLFLDAGDTQRARRDFDAAIAVAEPGSERERHVLWSRGWANYDLGEYEALLADWQRAVSLHGGKPSWAPYTFALLYWTMGQPDVALGWYQAAVAANGEWGNEAGFATRTKHWNPHQREAMQALFDEWLRRQG